MVTDIPLDLLLEVEQAAKNNTRLAIWSGDKNQPNYKGWAYYAVPIGIGWTGMGDPKPCLLCRTYDNTNHTKINTVPLQDLRKITTIPSRTPGRKALELWKAKWVPDEQ